MGGGVWYLEWVVREGPSEECCSWYLLDKKHPAKWRLGGTKWAYSQWGHAHMWLLLHFFSLPHLSSFSHWTCPPVGCHSNLGRPFYFAHPVAHQPTLSTHSILATSHGNIIEKTIDSITLYISSKYYSAVTENKSGSLVPREIFSHCLSFTGFLNQFLPCFQQKAAVSQPKWPRIALSDATWCSSLPLCTPTSLYFPSAYICIWDKSFDFKYDILPEVAANVQFISTHLWYLSSPIQANEQDTSMFNEPCRTKISYHAISLPGNEFRGSLFTFVRLALECNLANAILHL